MYSNHACGQSGLWPWQVPVRWAPDRQARQASGDVANGMLVDIKRALVKTKGQGTYWEQHSDVVDTKVRVVVVHGHGGPEDWQGGC